ncbi:neutral zinc metallopeptidase [Microbacterium sp. W1N]|uniref:KPN_02809 family neutral zinc metallopeptidase n=1 Tax=Microbacterium festucae TaxID=2977531 RepID=UPI0021BE04A2|nr:neutral zinc metallopeptidase [Microbacterium festucae]MCT9819241.1 neutral zinc metallopeptidase [Microbacterium festucae]
MTFNSGAELGGTTARKRGGLVAGGVGVAGLGGLAILLLNLFTGGDIGGLLGLGDGSGGAPASETVVADCEVGADANSDDECRLVFGQRVLDLYWQDHVQGYRPPQLIVVDGQTSTACGTASNQTGPFYCPPEETIYVDPDFFGLLRTQFDTSAGELAQLYVLAHEYGHHIQQITGVFDAYPPNGTGPESNGVRTELQADCLAGAWVASASQEVDANGVPYLQAPTEAQLRDALDAAAAVGDDHIQAQSGAVNPESWTHGSSEQRRAWFTAGYQNGLSACDTFEIPGSSL